MSVPRPNTTPTMTAAIAATMRPYSTADAPRSRARRLTLRRYASIEGSLQFLVGERIVLEEVSNRHHRTSARRSTEIGRTVDPRVALGRLSASGHARPTLASAP